MQINTLFIAGEVSDFKRITEKVSKISLKYEIGGKEKTSCTTEFTYFGQSIFDKGQGILIHGEIQQRLAENKTTGKAFSVTNLIAKDITIIREREQYATKKQTNEEEIPF